MADGLRLGIDTGGTFTDAVLCREDGAVFRTAKSLTTKHDLSIGIGKAIAAIMEPDGDDAVSADTIRLVSISTTLATNAVVESHGQPVCLIMIGETEAALDRGGLRQALGNDPAVFIAGGHQSNGDEATPLDIAAVETALDAHAGKVSAFAVSAHFGSRNPAHEQRVRDLVLERTGRPVTCGHELSANLDMPRRALTAVLNARLIPLIADLIEAVTGLLKQRGIAAPLMVVKGDGSLISAETARLRPVETVLSGPAASVVGARHLSGKDDLIVVDMGGTTTDIALLRGGKPQLDMDGANVSGWRTMVEAIAVHTVGLGGDSEIRLDDEKQLVAGPRRAVPLSLLAHEYDDVLPVLKKQANRAYAKTYDGRFAIRQRKLVEGAAKLSASEQRIWDNLADGPVALEVLLADRAPEQPLRRLVDRGLVAISAFSPSDAAHVLGLHHAWNAEAARLGGRIWARKEIRSGKMIAADEREFAQTVFDLVIKQAGEALVLAVLDAEGMAVPDRLGAVTRRLLSAAFSGKDDPTQRSELQVDLRFRTPVAGIGAPAATYYPAFGQRTGTQIELPPHADVSNAVGAVAGGVMQTVRVLISAPNEFVYRVHLPDGLKDFPSFESAAAEAQEQASAMARQQALDAGAGTVHVDCARDDRFVKQMGGRDLFVESTVTAVATGRPSLG
ncbi:hydantoinase/oxoprolinase N-terminal domain-containing protein [Hwanghaeella sp.]|uniref:hydantoinase/oxoprolinase N-terminal domain-containing protein n=1 Tax=Hwanghaeella sp. TaxID=2605943 RepID=UPI003CCC0372